MTTAADATSSQSPGQQSGLRAGLLLMWLLVAFGGVFFARDLSWVVAGWPFNFWYSAQGAVVLFIVIVAVYAWRRNKSSVDISAFAWEATAYSAYKMRLHRIVLIYIAGLLSFLWLMFFAERAGMSRYWVGGIFLIATIGLYACIGIYSRTADPSEYYVAGRRVPAMYNGMATAADWMSAASFISLAGTLYLQGFSGTPTQPGGLAYILGWTGGFCLVALLVAPHLRRAEVDTVPDFFQLRFGGKWPRLVAALSAVLCSFTYVVAQIYGVGLITSRLTGVQFEIGILLGLGGVLVCSFLGGMRAVTWTQVAQYIIIILAFLIPVSWLAYKQLGNPLAPLAYGQQIGKITTLEERLIASPAENSVIQEYGRRAKTYEAKLLNIEASLAEDHKAAQAKLRQLNLQRADASIIFAATRELAALPKDVNTARERWTFAMHDYIERAKPLAGMPRHAQPFAGDPDGTPLEKQEFNTSRLNFLALMFCLMIGTVGLPHLLTRYYTTPTVAEARTSVAWSLFFIALLYLSAPALAVLVKYEIMSNLVGLNFENLPTWIAQWSKVDPSLISVSDVNGDGILQFAELRLGADIVMLATPELGGLPYVVSGLVAAGGLAAALSTADGLLLTIGNALAHDVYKPKNKVNHGNLHRVMLSKFTLLLVALAAAYVASQRPAAILSLVAASFSLAGAAFVPAMVMGIYWRRTSRQGAVCGMLAGLAVTLYYMMVNSTTVQAALNWSGHDLWFDIQPISAGVFGVPAGFFVIWVVSLLFPHSRLPQTTQAIG
ncbi:MAG: VC_2705 family sodium/solute symporter [Burkholderiaceae bacterium]|nr:VC_2705 family sodium/solute symporter [Burkholderiaceae bacterium]